MQPSSLNSARFRAGDRVMPKACAGLDWYVTGVRQSEHTDLFIVTLDGDTSQATEWYEDELELLEATP